MPKVPVTLAARFCISVVLVLILDTIASVGSLHARISRALRRDAYRCR